MGQFALKFCSLTRMHSSRMRTIRSSGCISVGGVPSPWGGVPGPRGCTWLGCTWSRGLYLVLGALYLVQGERVYLVYGVYLVAGGAPGPGGYTWSRGHVPGPGGLLVPGGTWSGRAPGPRGVPGPRGGCTWSGTPPPVDRHMPVKT